MDLKTFLDQQPKIDRFTFGIFLKQRRLELGYKIKDFADELEVTGSYVADIEKGSRHAPIKLIEKIINLLKIEEKSKQDFIDIAYLTKETCSPDLIHYLTSSKEARLAIRYLIENNTPGDKLLEIVENNTKNL